MAPVNLPPDTTRILRHLVATIAYRASRSLRNVPEGFESVRLDDTAMSAGELILHMTNVMAFALATVRQTDRLQHRALAWPQEVTRFYSLLGELDSKLAAGAVLEEGMDLRLVQGPLADILTHIGQLHAMRRKAGAPVDSASYIKADVRIGRIPLEDQID